MNTKTQVVTQRFTVHEYHRMGEGEILHEDDRVELVGMAAIGTRHFSYANGLTRLLVRGVCDAAIVSVQTPVSSTGAPSRNPTSQCSE